MNAKVHTKSLVVFHLINHSSFLILNQSTTNRNYFFKLIGLVILEKFHLFYTVLNNSTMIKKNLLSLVIVAFMCFSTFYVHAQSNYTTAVGLSLDFGEGGTFVGPSLKHFFNERNAGDVELLFGSGVTMVNLLYQFHGNIENAEGLKWFAGAGPTILLGGGGSALALRPIVGMDYKFKDVPLSLALDWRTHL